MRYTILFVLGMSFLFSCQLETYLGNWKVVGTVSKNDPLALTGSLATYHR